MVGLPFTIVQPRTEWFKRVAGGLLERSPQMTPLEAMRRAMDAFPDAQHEDPDTVAAALMESDPFVAKPVQRSRSKPWLT